MDNDTFALEVVARLNALVLDPSVRKDVSAVIDARVTASDATRNHTHIVTTLSGTVGALGVIQGLVGDTTGDKRVTAVYDDGTEELLHFILQPAKYAATLAP